MPHIATFRRDEHGLHFRIKRDEDYWTAIKQLEKGFPSKVTFTAGANEFMVPNTPRVRARLAAIFPEDFTLINTTNTDNIRFTPQPDQET
jgi:hypothetical protein